MMFAVPNVCGLTLGFVCLPAHINQSEVEVARRRHAVEEPGRSTNQMLGFPLSITVNTPTRAFYFAHVIMSYYYLILSCGTILSRKFVCGYVVRVWFTYLSKKQNISVQS